MLSELFKVNPYAFSRQIKEHQAGKYTCKLDTASGSAESSTDVVVKRKHLSPVFLRRLQPIWVEEGQRIVAEVEIGGMPAPHVYWFKDDELLREGRIKFSKSGPCYAMIIENPLIEDTGTYLVKAQNEAGEASSSTDFEVRPPLPLEVDEPPPRPPSPVESKLTLSKESSTLKVLAGYHQRTKELPELLPFPFEPDPPIAKKKNAGKVPKPSKFYPGSMYHSDYESDWEGNIKPKWRAYNSDTEHDLVYKKVKPNLKEVRQRKDRKPSPPCPHKWESHEEIERLEAELSRASSKRSSAEVVKEVKTSTLQEMLTVEIQETVKKTEQTNGYQQLRLKRTELQPQDNLKPLHDVEFQSKQRQVVNKTVDQQKPQPVKLLAKQLEDQIAVQFATDPRSPPPLPAKVRTNVLSPTQSSSSQTAMSLVSSFTEGSSDDFSSNTQSTVIQQRQEFIRVKDKIKMIEQKVEDTLDTMSDTSSARQTPTIRPEEIPGAVRVLPPATSPMTLPRQFRWGHSSIARSNSVDVFKSSPIASPLTIPRSAQPSPSNLKVSTIPRPKRLAEMPLEPFPFKADPVETKTRTKIPAPPTPKRFVPGAFKDASDYDSTSESSTSFGLAKWTPKGDKKVEPKYKPVKVDLQKIERKNEFTKSPTPPSKFETPLENGVGKPRPEMNLDEMVKEIKRENLAMQNAVTDTLSKLTTSNEIITLVKTETTETSYSQQDCVTTEQEIFQSGASTLERSCKSENQLTDSEIEQLNNVCATKERKKSGKSPRATPTGENKNVSPKLPRFKHGFKTDGYEADTDDTLSRQKRSVKDLAKSFQDAENACPSPIPFRPRCFFIESDYESSDIDSASRPMSRWSKTPEPKFTPSKAYVPPSWASEMKSESSQILQQRSDLHIVRCNHQEISTFTSFADSATSRISSKDERELDTNSVKVKLSPVVFNPKKFVPGTTFEESAKDWAKDFESKIQPKWKPSNESDQTSTTPQYRKIHPILQSKSPHKIT